MQKSDSTDGKTKEVWWRKPVETFLKMSGWIAVPIILALIVGKYLDTRYDTKPWIFLGCTALAFLISIISIARMSMKYIKEISELAEKNDDTRDDNK